MDQDTEFYAVLAQDLTRTIRRVPQPYRRNLQTWLSQRLDTPVTETNAPDQLATWLRQFSYAEALDHFVTLRLVADGAVQAFGLPHPETRHGG